MQRYQMGFRKVFDRLAGRLLHFIVPIAFFGLLGVAQQAFANTAYVANFITSQ